MICGTLRWEGRGAVWTAIVTVVLYAGTSAVRLVRRSGCAPSCLNTFLIRIVHLAVVAVLVGYLGAHHHRFQRELGRLVGLAAARAAAAPRTGRGAGERVLGRARSAARADRVGGARGRIDQPGLGRGRRRHAGDRARSDATGRSWCPGLERGTFSDDARERRERRRDPLVGGIVPEADRPADSSGTAGPVRHGAGPVLEPRRRADPRPAVRAGQAAHADRRSDFRRDRRRLAVSRLDSLYLLRRLGKAAALEERLRAGAGHPRQPVAVGRGQRAAARRGAAAARPRS